MRKVIQSEMLHACVCIDAGVEEAYKDVYGSRENKFLMMGCNE